GVYVAGVEHAADGTRVTSRGPSSLVDASVALEQVWWLDVTERGHPSVRQAPDDREHSRPVRAQPHPQRMHRHRTRVRAFQLVILAREADAVLAAPEQADHRDRLF